MNLLLKTNDGRNRIPDFTIFVVWSASYVLVASLRRGGSFPSSGFYGQLAGCYSHDFSVIRPANEFSFKEMRTWGQFKISFCCLSVRCKSGEMGGRESPRFTNGGELLCRPSRYSKLLDRVAFRIPSNIDDGAPL